MPALPSTATDWDNELIWRNDAQGQAGLRTPDSVTEVVLTTALSYEPNWKVRSAGEAAGVFVANGGRMSPVPTTSQSGQSSSKTRSGTCWSCLTALRAAPTGPTLRVT
jgi:hypothetical protein